ncbi:DUF1499 domain-containing protein [Dongia sedimenti]|uniref:DUF1499 domain-containing protein n=1 Tax=Dongia sedimenti TaxID=3064282 RepID=A0ABU0YQT4_9PROT|nr:DUF1499 domain-containing protein [Rhodospirillaceae bacterium R-7]
MKRRTRIVWNILIVLLILVAGTIATVRILVQPALTDFVDFAELKRSPTRNDALACPPGLCTAKVDLTIAPVAMSAAALAAKIKALPDTEPRTIIVGENDAEFRYVLVQRSALFNFPDTINIAIQPLDASHAALAIYSRSRYGKGDLGVNMKRLQRWLELLGVGVLG